MTNGCIKVLITDYTTKMKPDRNGNTEVCNELVKQINSAKMSFWRDGEMFKNLKPGTVYKVYYRNLDDLVLVNYEKIRGDKKLEMRGKYVNKTYSIGFRWNASRFYEPMD